MTYSRPTPPLSPLGGSVSTPPFRVLAIDPGTLESAYVLWDGERVVEAAKVENAALLALCRRPVKYAQATACVIEKIESFGMAVGAEVFETVFWSGRFAEAWRMATDTEAARIGRRDVKLAICGDSRAKDPNIRQALIDRIGPRGTKKQPGPTFGLAGDEWSALAVAVAWCDRRALPARSREG